MSYAKTRRPSAGAARVGKDLAHYLEKMSGAAVPVVTDAGATPTPAPCPSSSATARPPSSGVGKSYVFKQGSAW